MLLIVYLYQNAFLRSLLFLINILNISVNQIAALFLLKNIFSHYEFLGIHVFIEYYYRWISGRDGIALYSKSTLGRLVVSSDILSLSKLN